MKYLLIILLFLVGCCNLENYRMIPKEEYKRIGYVEELIPSGYPIFNSPEPITVYYFEKKKNSNQ